MHQTFGARTTRCWESEPKRETSTSWHWGLYKGGYMGIMEKNMETIVILRCLYRDHKVFLGFKRFLGFGTFPKLGIPFWGPQ